MQNVHKLPQTLTKGNNVQIRQPTNYADSPPSELNKEHEQIRGTVTINPPTHFITEVNCMKTSVLYYFLLTTLISTCLLMGRCTPDVP